MLREYLGQVELDLSGSLVAGNGGRKGGVAQDLGAEINSVIRVSHWLSRFHWKGKLLVCVLSRLEG